MDRRHRRRGFVAAAGMALLVADVRGFAFTLQHRAATARSTPTAVGGRAATREASSRGSGSVAAAAPWGSRRPRTALRCVCVCARRGFSADVEVDELQQQLFQPPGAARATAPTTSDVQPNRNPLGVWPGGDWPGQDPVVVRIAAQLSSTLAKMQSGSLSLTHTLSL